MTLKRESVVLLWDIFDQQRTCLVLVFSILTKNSLVCKLEFRFLVRSIQTGTMMIYWCHELECAKLNTRSFNVVVDIVLSSSHHKTFEKNVLA